MAEKEPELIPLGIEDAKRWLRRFAIRQRQAMAPDARGKASRAIVRHVARSSFFTRARTVALFLGFGSEVDTGALLREAWKRGKTTVIPVTSRGIRRPYFAVVRKGDALERTPFGPLELVERRTPFDFSRIDVVFVPGLAFDGSGGRIGYGGGVYDRMLAKAARSLHVGLYFAEQELYRVPSAAHDRPLDLIVTERGVLKPGTVALDWRGH